jgi:hypothetical protein
MKAQHVLAIATIAFASAAGAQSLKPGLWEITQQMKSDNPEHEKARAQMQQQMAAMSPAQRKQMEEMMASRGVKMGPDGPGSGMSVKVCMTKEMTERAEMPMSQQHQGTDCKTTQQSRSGNTMKMAYTCTTPPSSGEGEMTFTSPEAYSMKMAITSNARGKPEKMNMEASGKWLGADCGTVKPIVLPPKK